MTAWSLRFLLCLLLFATSLQAARFRFHRPHGIGNRNRVHINRLITEPGTVEMEASASEGSFPTLLKYTPINMKTELSIGFDWSHLDNDITVAANTLLYDGEHWNVSLGPALTFVRYNASGVRSGANLVTRYDRGLFSAGTTAAWSKASNPNENNPADQVAIGLGGGIRLAASGWRSHLTLNGNVLNERASAVHPATSAFEGLEWELTGRISANFVIQQLDFRGPGHDNVALIGITVNFGRLRLPISK